MSVVDLPQPAELSDYDEAITRYAELVRSRAIAVYRVGNVRHPGISDIDLLVVTDRCSIDNQYFYSALQRMPRRYLPLFLHDPFILPAWSLRVMRHTMHYAPVLLAGRDVLRDFAPNDERDERWCRMLEGYCSYANFAARMREADTLKGRMTIAVASAFRYQLADAQVVLSQGDGQEYASRVDALRAGFFERSNPSEAVEEAWALFSQTFDAFDADLRSRLQTHTAADAFTKARALLHGDLETPLFDREYAFHRARGIDGYHKDLASMGFPYGHLFFIAAYPGAVPARDGASLINGVVRNLYRVRRRLEEYARA